MSRYPEPVTETGCTVFGVGRLIVGTSGSPGSLRALRYGEGLARAHDAVLIPVIAWELPGGDRAHRIGPSYELEKACRELASQQLRDARARDRYHLGQPGRRSTAGTRHPDCQDRHRDSTLTRLQSPDQEGRQSPERRSPGAGGSLRAR